MNYIIAIIQPPKVDAVRQALTKAGVTGLTVSDVQGYGRQKGHSEVYRGAEYSVNFVRKVKLEIACNEHDVDKIVAAISSAAKSDAGKVGDGKIFVLELKDAVRVRTNEHGAEAI